MFFQLPAASGKAKREWSGRVQVRVPQWFGELGLPETRGGVICQRVKKLRTKPQSVVVKQRHTQ